ncbi:hypothetical protein MLD38_007776 [Melastoma candidum]|uniref:Uncharacterized protein n=1 Tax=Melastoma candidum TaxID=119954 RepID=A0ACB9RSC4_9MYRT|nr:hypothetical protein MLD38_007776 [Melastoma candidum]
MGCVCSKGSTLESREGPSEPAVVLPRQTPSHPPALLAKSYSFHVFEKLDASEEANKAVFRTGSVMTVPRVETEGIKPVRENFFIQRDRMEMQRVGKVATFHKRMSGRPLQARALRHELTQCDTTEDDAKAVDVPRAVISTDRRRPHSLEEKAVLGSYDAVKDGTCDNLGCNKTAAKLEKKVDDFGQSNELPRVLLLRIKG